jgi:hypothetical protein
LQDDKGTSGRRIAAAITIAHHGLDGFLAAVAAELPKERDLAARVLLDLQNDYLLTRFAAKFVLVHRRSKIMKDKPQKARPHDAGAPREPPHGPRAPKAKSPHLYLARALPTNVMP